MNLFQKFGGQSITLKFWQNIEESPLVLIAMVQHHTKCPSWDSRMRSSTARQRSSHQTHILPTSRGVVALSMAKRLPPSTHRQHKSSSGLPPTKSYRRSIQCFVHKRRNQVSQSKGSGSWQKQEHKLQWWLILKVVWACSLPAFFSRHFQRLWTQYGLHGELLCQYHDRDQQEEQFSDYKVKYPRHDKRDLEWSKLQSWLFLVCTEVHLDHYVLVDILYNAIVLSMGKIDMDSARSKFIETKKQFIGHPGALQQVW
jgi:hypothetical protein